EADLGRGEVRRREVVVDDAPDPGDLHGVLEGVVQLAGVRARAAAEADHAVVLAAVVRGRRASRGAGRRYRPRPPRHTHTAPRAARPRGGAPGRSRYRASRRSSSPGFPSPAVTGAPATG